MLFYGQVLKKINSNIIITRTHCFVNNAKVGNTTRAKGNNIMESSEKTIVKGISERKTIQKKNGCAVSLFYVRASVCLIMFGGVMFVKLNNPCLFENFRFWYQNNVYEEKFTVEEIRQAAVSTLFTAKEKVLNMLSKFS